MSTSLLTARRTVTPPSLLLTSNSIVSRFCGCRTGGRAAPPGCDLRALAAWFRFVSCSRISCSTSRLLSRASCVSRLRPAPPDPQVAPPHLSLAHHHAAPFAPAPALRWPRVRTRPWPGRGEEQRSEARKQDARGAGGAGGRSAPLLTVLHAQLGSGRVGSGRTDGPHRLSAQGAHCAAVRCVGVALASLPDVEATDGASHARSRPLALSPLRA